MVQPVSKIGKILIDLNMSYDPASSLLNIYSRKMKTYAYQKFIQNILSHFIMIAKLDITQISANWRMDKQNVVLLQNDKYNWI